MNAESVISLNTKNSRNFRKKKFKCDTCFQTFKTYQGWLYHRKSSKCNKDSTTYNDYDKNGYIYTSPFDLHSDGSESESLEIENSPNYYTVPSISPNIDPSSIKSERIKKKMMNYTESYSPEIHTKDTTTVSTESLNKSQFSNKYKHKATTNKKRVPLTYAEAQKIVEFEHPTEGYRRILIDEQIDIIDEPCDQDLIQNVTSENEITRSFKQNLSLLPNNLINKEACYQNSDSIHTKSGEITQLIRNPITSRSNNVFFRMTFKHLDQIEGRVEYDVDEDDISWLTCINMKYGFCITVDVFESIIDHFERISLFKGQNDDCQPLKNQLEVDEDAVCSVCNDGDCSNCNAILFCDMCNLAVHQDCYGIPYVPEGQWLCRKCLHSPSRPVSCSLCHSLTGAFKKTNDGRWAHVICALYIPEVRFANPVFLEPIEGVESIPPARRRLICNICKLRGGACIQCSKDNCYVAFHVTCAQNCGNYLKLELLNNSNPEQGESTTIDPNAVKRISYCTTHSIQYKSNNKNNKDQITKPNTTDYSVNDKISVHLPIITDEQLSNLMNKFNINKTFAQLIRSYWIIKRFMRNGVPLLRRLQFNSPIQTDTTPNLDKNILQSKEFLDILRNHELLSNQSKTIRNISDIICQRELIKSQLLQIDRKILQITNNDSRSFKQRIIEYYMTINSLTVVKTFLPYYIETIDFVNFEKGIDDSTLINESQNLSNNFDVVENSEDEHINPVSDSLVANKSLSHSFTTIYNKESNISYTSNYNNRKISSILYKLSSVLKKMDSVFDSTSKYFQLRDKLLSIPHESYKSRSNATLYSVCEHEENLYDQNKITMIKSSVNPSKLDNKRIVWAKCFHYPPYPATIVCSAENYSSKSTTIPPDIKNTIHPKSLNEFLVRFFDQRSTWQWIPRNKINLLGIDRRLDMYNLVQSYKYRDILVAYSKAIDQITE